MKKGISVHISAEFQMGYLSKIHLTSIQHDISNTISTETIEIVFIKFSREKIANNSGHCRLFFVGAGQCVINIKSVQFSSSDNCGAIY